MQQRRREQDRLWKVYTPRWPRSGDGLTYYKTDTSSDELDGHYFFYAQYFDHVAETDEEKAAVREVVRELTDHLIRNDFCLVDHDGRPTRWGVFSPWELNQNPGWHVERGLNSLSMLSYLAVATHVTGDSRYDKAMRRLIDEHHYAQNAMVPKIQSGIGSGNQSDDEMAFMSFYNLLQFSDDEALKRELRLAFYRYWTLEFPELNPFFNFAYAACAGEAQYEDPWNVIDLAPWEGWHEDSIAVLRGFPMDRANWSHQNSHRLDLIRLPAQSAVSLARAGSENRGHRVDGKVLPVQERHFNHWNTDPFRLDYGGDGRQLASGTVFLLPYYMGLYHGYIKTPPASAR